MPAGNLPFFVYVIRAALAKNPPFDAALAQGHQGDAEQGQHGQQEPAPTAPRSSQLLRPGPIGNWS